jgi:hypothetical protein
VSTTTGTQAIAMKPRDGSLNLKYDEQKANLIESRRDGSPAQLPQG